MDAIVVVHFLSDAKEELASLEHVDHNGNVLLDFLESFLGLLAIVLVLLDFGLVHGAFVLERLLQVKFAHVGELASLDDLLDLLLNLLVALFKLVILGVEHINIVLKTIILLFSLDESGDNLLDVGDTGGLLDLVESVLDDLHVSEILVHKLSLLFVGLDNLIESPLPDDNRVGGTSHFVSAAFLATLLIEILIVKVDHLIFFLQFLLQFLDNILEFFFFFFVFGLQSNNLIISLLSNLAHRLIVLVLEFSLFFGLLYLFLISRTFVFA